jgi:hypothetical protein
MQAADFGDAQAKLENFADAIFSDPSCLRLYSDDEQKAVKDLVIERALKYLQEAGVSPDDAIKLIRDNLIKIHHQQTVDH